MSQLICPNCGVIGVPKIVTKGSILIEIILWICLIIPGVIYGVWRITTRVKVCHSCGAENMVLLNSPVGEKLQMDKNINSESRKCPYCTEKINKKARVCKHCSSDITPVYVDDKKANNQIHKIIMLHDDQTFIKIAQILNDDGEIYLKDNTEWNEQKVQYVVDSFKN